MSAFLGPIHYWLYNKIQLQQGIVDELYSLGNQFDLNLEEDCNNKFGEFLNNPLEEIIDPSNIHGWLQERVSQVEYKYAYCVTTLLKKDSGVLNQIKDILFNQGKELGQTVKGTNVTAPALFKIISDNLLDGMPCDNANSIVDQMDDEVVWKRNLCVHTSYWEQVDGDISIYYELRETFLQGLVRECGFTFEKINNVTYRIKKEA